MSKIYLTGIELEQFRSFSTLRVDLAPEPNVLIVHGSNGLGKSSLFDAVEWTLTDNIDHFRRANGYEKVGKYLCRWQQKLGPTRASLRFSDGATIDRQLASADAVTSALVGSLERAGDIAHYLRAPSWSQTISGLDRYLLLTHFLGQSILSRLTHKTDADRFAILKEAAQSAELEAFGVALHGKGTNSSAKAFGKRISELERDMKALSDLLEQEEELWQGAQASGGLDEAAVEQIAQQLGAVLTRLSASPAIVEPRSDAEQQAAIDGTVERLRLNRLKLAHARLNQDEMQRNEMSAAENVAAQKDIQRELAERKTEAAQRIVEASLTREYAVQQMEVLGAAQRRHSQLSELLALSARLNTVEKEGTLASSALRHQKQVLATTDAVVAKAERRRQMIGRLQSQIADIQADLDECDRAVERINEWLQQSASINSLKSSLSSLQQIHPDVNETVRAAESALADSTRDAGLQARLLEQIKEMVGAMTAAIATVATSLPAGSCDCPVCDTHFDSATELRERVAHASERLAPLLAGQLEAYSSAQRLADDAATRLEVARFAQSQIQELSAELAIALSSHDRLFEKIAWSGVAEVDMVPSHRKVLGYRVTTLRRRHRRKQYWIEVLSSEDAFVAEASALRLRDEALRQRQALDRQVITVETTIRELSTRIAAHTSSLFPGEDGALETEYVLSAVALATEEIQKAVDASGAAEGSAGEAETRAALQQTSVARLTARASELAELAAQSAKALERNRRRWVTLGWSEQGPGPGELERAEQQLAIDESSLEEASSLLKKVREGREAWARQRTHAASFERLRSATDLAPNSERTQIRGAAQKNLAAISHLLDATKQAKHIAGQSSTAIATEVEEFNADYIQPLDVLMKKINRAILCDPRVGIDLHVKRRTIGQSAAREGDLPQNIGPIDPLLVHSEGQMAALAVSMLCAASLTYPWSRWQALILDDPLQHNDAIHASAFADLIGNLVEHRKYQVLLSTHDLAQAEFLQRKFDARRIPSSTLSLLGRGKEGVKWNYSDRRRNTSRKAGIES